MKRPTGIVITAIIQFLGSLLVLFMAVAMLTLPNFAPKTPNSPEVPTGLFVALGVFYAALTVIGLATAVGVFRSKEWSRYSTLIFAGILVCFALLLALAFAVMPFPPPSAKTSAQLPPIFALTFKTIMVLIQLMIAALGAWWLYYFNRKPIRIRFDGGTSDGTQSSGRPLSIVALAVLHLFGLPWMLVGTWMAFPVVLFGVIVRGLPVRCIYLLFFALNLYLGIGLLRLAAAARRVAIGIYLFGCVNTLLFWVLPGRDERFQIVLTQSLGMWHLPNLNGQSPPFPGSAWIGTISSVAFSAIAIYFLVTRRSAFERGAGIAQPPGHSSLVSA